MLRTRLDTFAVTSIASFERAVPSASISSVRSTCSTGVAITGSGPLCVARAALASSPSRMSRPALRSRSAVRRMGSQIRIASSVSRRRGIS
jgi:hypothetical protein